VTTVPETGTTLFTTSTVENREEKVSAKDGEDGQGSKGEKPLTTSPEKEVTSEGKEQKEAKTKTPSKSKDPIRMFGILTPQSLRIAQSKAVETVETIIPRLVSIDAELKEVEIQVRRARKYKAKAEGMETKKAQNAEGHDTGLAQVVDGTQETLVIF
jgi:hypothetical protein